MYTSLPRASKALPSEYKNTAEKLFPMEGIKDGKGPTLELAEAFADILGIGDDYRKQWKTYKSEQTPGKYLEHFQNNLDLLIQKTWVEKADEIRKENLLDKVPPFIALIENGDYPKALEEFGEILEELAYLFFGTESQNEDFAEYALRIDTRIGLFWWYGGQINGAKNWLKQVDRNVIYALLLLGICYLTDF